MTKTLTITQLIQKSIHAIDRIHRFTEDMDSNAFANNEMIQFAVIKNMEIISDLTSQLPVEVKGKYHSINWKQLEGVRNIFFQRNYRINHELLWNTKEDKLPDLRSKLMDILEAETGPT